MNQFDDETTRQIYETRFAPGVPQQVSIAAHEVVRLLVAARNLQDVSVLGRIRRWPNLPGRYGINIDGKWHATFAWNDEFGANSIRVERR